MTRTLRQFSALARLAMLGILVACTASSDTAAQPAATATEVPERVVVTAADVPNDQAPSNHRIEPLGIITASGPPGKFDVAPTEADATEILDYVWESLDNPRLQTTGSIGTAGDVDYTTSMLVAVTADGCVLDEFWLEPLTNVLVSHTTFDELVDCAQANYFTAVFAVPLAGEAGDGGNYSYSASAVPAVIPARIDASGYSLTDPADTAEPEPFPLPERAVESETWIALWDIDWIDEETTRFVLDEDGLAWLIDAVGESGWTAGQRQLATLDFATSYAVVLIAELCSPSRFWVEHDQAELAFSVGESGEACDQKDPYAALFFVPRTWQLPDDDSPVFTVDRMRPDPGD